MAMDINESGSQYPSPSLINMGFISKKARNYYTLLIEKSIYSVFGHGMGGNEERGFRIILDFFLKSQYFLLFI
jgi:hypothetical protein